MRSKERYLQNGHTPKIISRELPDITNNMIKRKVVSDKTNDANDMLT